MTDQKRIRWLKVGWAGFGLALFAVTYRLWIDSSESFPHVPLLNIGQRLPSALDVFGFAILVVTMVAVATGRSQPAAPDDGRRAGIGVRWTQQIIGLHVATLIIMIAANQHRLQPWAYLSAIIGIVLACSQPKQAVKLLRIVLIGVYLHSAISKIDYEFAHGMGQSFLRTLAQPLGITIDDWSRTTAAVVPLAFPLIELLTAIGLAIPTTRQSAKWLAVVMHIGLLFVLGPWGLGQQPAVLIWNAFFVFLVIVLFHRESANAAEETISQRNPWNALAVTVAAVTFVLPFLEPLKRFDHWPSWGLYAPRNARVVVFVEEAGVEKIPESYRSLLTETRFKDPEFPTTASRLSLNRLSLDTLQVPLYPQDRFQIGVALAIAERYELEDSIHVEHQGAANRRFGDREKEMFNGVDELRAAANRFRLNAKPRE